MSSRLAVLSTTQAAESAPVSFATLVGPTRAPRHQASTRSGRREAPHRKAQTPESNLLAIVAHELRNPLASLRLSLDMLVNDFDELEPDNALKLIRRAQRSAAYLQGMTENLTSSAAIAAGTLQAQPKTIDLRVCIEEAVLLVHGLLEQRGQTVRYTTTATSNAVTADPARVIQVLANLLANASRYSVEGDEIELHVSSVNQHLRIRVVDHGPGITPEEQQRIFGAWVRAQDAVPGGLGLGLSIVQNLIHQQGGRVGVESTVGQGATFWFTLPMASDSTTLAGVATEA
jgi:signal transduction histidine kinase